MSHMPPPQLPPQMPPTGPGPYYYPAPGFPTAPPQQRSWLTPLLFLAVAFFGWKEFANRGAAPGPAPTPAPAPTTTDAQLAAQLPLILTDTVGKDYAVYQGQLWASLADIVERDGQSATARLNRNEHVNDRLLETATVFAASGHPGAGKYPTFKVQLAEAMTRNGISKTPGPLTPESRRQVISAYRTIAQTLITFGES